jgi:O-acetylhomoserine/O-acetylserine sulfhydrylase-like pyridoxal-dependent enzyme
VRFYDALKIFKRLVNIGDAKSWPATPPPPPIAS